MVTPQRVRERTAPLPFRNRPFTVHAPANHGDSRHASSSNTRPQLALKRKIGKVQNDVIVRSTVGGYSRFQDRAAPDAERFFMAWPETRNSTKKRARVGTRLRRRRRSRIACKDAQCGSALRKQQSGLCFCNLLNRIGDGFEIYLSLERWTEEKKILLSE